MDVYFDTEFTDFLDPALISIGLVTDDGREFYAELDDNYQLSMCSWFVQDEVLPILWGERFSMGSKKMAASLKSWIESFGEPVRLMSDAPAYDWPFIEDIFEQQGQDWPENLLRECGNTQSFESDDERIRYDVAFESYWQAGKDSGAVRHHALWDARCIRHAHHHALQKRQGEAG